MKVGIYARVSTFDQEPENQLAELREYTLARGWTSVEYVDRGISGSKDSRPALDQLVADARRRKFDVLLCWRLDRLGRNLRHLVVLLEDLRAVGVEFVSLNEGIDATTPAGKLQLHILAALAEFERERIRERVHAGLARARAQGKVLGRPRTPPPFERLSTVAQLSLSEGAAALGVSLATIKRWRRSARESSAAAISLSPRNSGVPGTGAGSPLGSTKTRLLDHTLCRPHVLSGAHSPTCGKRLRR